MGMDIDGEMVQVMEKVQEELPSLFLFFTS
jgi:hypothetical protein